MMSKISLSSPDQTAINTFIEQVKKLDVQGVILYGSKARGDADLESDIDLLVIMDNEDWQTRHVLSTIASKISLAYDVTLSVQLVSQRRWQQMAQAPFLFFENVFHDGIPLWGGTHLFKDVLKTSRQSMPIAELVTLRA